MRRISTAILIINGIFGSAASAAAQTRFELAPASTSALLGSPFKLRGRAVFPEGYELSLDLAKQPTGAFEVLRVEAGEARGSGGMREVPLVVRAAAFGLGEQTLPALRWTLKPTAGGVAGELSSPPVRMDIQAPQPRPDDTGDIRDIRGPLSPRLWPYLAAAALAATALGVWLWRRRRPGGAPLFGPSPGPPRLPHEVALAELQALDPSALPVKEFYDRVSDILRAYFEPRFGLSALSMTTQGLMRAMLQAEMDHPLRTRTRALLDRCDLAKFAKYQPPVPEREKDRGSAVDIVRSTAPRLEPKPEAAGAAAGGPRLGAGGRP